MGFVLHFYLEIEGLNLSAHLQVPSALVNELGCALGFITLSHTQLHWRSLLCKGLMILMLIYSHSW